MGCASGAEGGTIATAAHPCGTSWPRGAAGPCALKDKAKELAEAAAKETGSAAAAVCPRGLSRTRTPCASRPRGKAKKAGSAAAAAHLHVSVRSHGASGQYAREHKAGVAGVANTAEAEDRVEGRAEDGAEDGKGATRQAGKEEQ